MTLDPPFRILAVCTGNICRSPMVERLLQGAFDCTAPGEFEISSAGTAARVGSPIDAQVAGLVRVFDGNPEGFRARQLEESILQDQDLVLTLTREHRKRVVEMAPSLLRKTFTLREFARLVTTLEGDSSLDGPHRWRAILPMVVRARTVHPSNPLQDDVVDPFRRPETVYQQMARELVPAVKTLAHWEHNYR
ncbi:arsenate reductase/protein-tyrosine-phosphatase family protein [Arthrobacter agilis]|uniref:arsenate reductase/protein-tyrosine-phosphatase family protein n=1 Tax=Arthrobacter agilis TaxID=37921 RepID=UPI0027845009|nr:low molecular weight phosphatase family protein [Arthrobacter agilis]MDQ0734051.1 protein-tyrosine phosphatase [Arthrobacter agilis]